MLSKVKRKQINSLVHKKYRRQYQQYFIEGARLVGAAVEARIKFDALYLTRDFLENMEHQELINDLNAGNFQWEIVADNDLKTLSDTIHPAGILALLPLPPPRKTDYLPSGPWLYCDGISDPGNLGTLLRSAAWFGVTNIGLSDNCVDPWNPKVVRSGMGAHFGLHLYTDLKLTGLKASGHQILGADMGGIPLNKIDRQLNEKWVLVLGGEAHGLSEHTQQIIDQFISIPKTGTGESLNAAVAGSVLLAQLTG